MTNICMTWPQYLRNEVSFNGRRLKLRHKEAEILSILLMRRGETVHSRDLTEAMYPDPDNQPLTCLNCLQAYISRLRKRIPGVIRSQGHWGYTIGVVR